MRKNKNTSKIILTLIVASLATMICYTAFTKMQNDLKGKEQLIQLMQNNPPKNTTEDFAYAIATKELKAGEIVTDTDVDFKQFPSENKDAFDNRSDVVNKVLLQDIPMGEVFTSTHIAKISNDSDGIALKNGYRALTLPAESFQGRSSKMTVGSSVDIFSLNPESNWSLDNIRILSFEGVSATVPATSLKNASTIDFEVPANRIADFISNASKSRMVLVARRPGDTNMAKKPSQNIPKPNNYGGNSLPNLPANVPIGDLPGDGLSGLPDPIQPTAPTQEVEIIEANVKSKITFD